MRGIDRLMAVVLALFFILFSWKFMPHAAAAERILTITVIAQDVAANTVTLHLDDLEQLVRGFNRRGKQLEDLNKLAKGCS